MQNEADLSTQHGKTARRPGSIDGPALLSACSPRIAKFYGLWDSKRASRVLPSRGDFDVMELKPWLGWITLIDVLPDALPDGHDFRYRLVGSNFVRFHHSDPTGRHVSEATLATDPRVMLKNLRDVCCSRTPRYRDDAIPCSDFKIYTPPRIYLPLGDDDETVNIIMILGIDPIDDQGNTVATPQPGLFRTL